MVEGTLVTVEVVTVPGIGAEAGLGAATVVA